MHSRVVFGQECAQSVRVGYQCSFPLAFCSLHFLRIVEGFRFLFLLIYFFRFGIAMKTGYSKIDVASDGPDPIGLHYTFS